jgi:EAL domain-containing protein (putative c-di-GMP-specific phosphodiesterase class I)/AmiR/NasT family two-component response regulator
MMSSAVNSPLRMLVVDDDPELLRAIARTLRASGHEVDLARMGDDAIARIGEDTYDVVLSDIAMPGMDGVALLQAIRERDLHVPVLLVTGQPSLDTAVQAVEHGAFRYFTKPVAADELQKAAVTAARMYRMAQVKSAAADVLGLRTGLGADRTGLEAGFRRALDSLWMAYQPIFDASAGTVYGFEALLRTREPSLSHPESVLDAAERLGRLGDVGRRVRARTATDLASVMQGTLLFVNLHASDLLDEELFDRDAPLSHHAAHVVLEITERSSLSRIDDVRARVAKLRDLGFRVAIDDLGAGYAGLNSFALLEPDFVKLDMDLVRGVHHSRTKRKIIASMVKLAADMGMRVIAEGIASVAERDAVLALGCNLLQGYFLGEPTRAASSASPSPAPGPITPHVGPAPGSPALAHARST